jgi:hypothetical protein
MIISHQRVLVLLGVGTLFTLSLNANTPKRTPTEAHPDWGMDLTLTGDEAFTSFQLDDSNAIDIPAKQNHPDWRKPKLPSPNTVACQPDSSPIPFELGLQLAINQLKIQVSN